MNGCRFELFQPASHAGAVELKGALCFAAREHLVGCDVVNRNVLNIYLDAARLFDARNGVGEYGEVLDAEEIKFQEPDPAVLVGDGVHIILRDEFAGTLRVGLNRRPLDKRGRRDHDARRVDTDMPYASLDAFREVNSLSGIVVFVIQRFQIRLQLKRAVNGHRESLRANRDELRDAVAGGVGMTERARDVTHRRPRHHGAEGAYLRDMVLSVFPLRIRNHIVSTIVGDIHINIRRFRALGIQESFKGQFIEQRVYSGNTRQICDETSSRRAARGGEDALTAGEREQVGDDEVIHRESFADDNIQFVFDAASDFLRFFECAGGDTGIGLRPQLFIMILKTGRDGHGGEGPFSEFKGYRATVCNCA